MTDYVPATECPWGHHAWHEGVCWAGRKLQLSRWWKRVQCRLRGGHFVDTENWGYGMGGMVDLYCAWCQSRQGSVPLEDFEEMKQVLDVMSEIPPEVEET